MIPPFIIRHDESGDEAEAASYEAAFVAARTLLDDNGGAGVCRVYRLDTMVEMVWNDAGTFKHFFGRRVR